MGIIWAHKKPFSIPHSLTNVSLFVSRSHFPNQVLKRNIKHLCSTVPPLSCPDCVCVCVHGVYDPALFRCFDLAGVLLRVCDHLRTVQRRRLRNAPFSLQRQLTVNSTAALHQSSAQARANNESGSFRHRVLVFLFETLLQNTCQSNSVTSFPLRTGSECLIGRALSHNFGLLSHEHQLPRSSSVYSKQTASASSGNIECSTF